MGEALIAALLRQKIYKASDIGVSEPDPTRQKYLKSRYKVRIFDTNISMTQAASILLLAVKPQQMSLVLAEIRGSLKPSHLVISIAAGLDSHYFIKHLPAGTRLIRVMPNVCAMIGEGAAALYATTSATQADRRLALRIFRSSGQAIFVEREELLDTVTAVSGSGPAFVFLFMEAILEEAQKLGLSEAAARPLLIQTVIGAARMIEKSSETIATLIQKVTSKGGTTEAGLKVLDEGLFTSLVSGAIRAAARRAEELRRCIS